MQPLQRASKLQKKHREKGRCHKEGCEILHASANLPVDNALGDFHLKVGFPLGAFAAQIHRDLVNVGAWRPGLASQFRIRVVERAPRNDDARRANVGIETLVIRQNLVEADEFLQVEFENHSVIETSAEC